MTPPARNIIRIPLKDEKVLLDSASVFYTKEKSREDKELAEISLPSLKIDTVQDGTILLRVGRHSGAEAVTIDGHRNIRIKLNDGKTTQGTRATTFWLASESSVNYQKNRLRPFGWAALSTVPPILPVEGKDIIKSGPSEDLVNLAVPQREDLEPVDKFIAAIKQLEANDAGKIGSTIDNALRNLASDEDKSKFAQAVKDHMGKDFKKSKARIKVGYLLDAK
jgi:hypothetical protein